MVFEPILLFSDSNILIGDVEYVFREKYDLISSESIMWIQDYLIQHQVKLVIADLDMEMVDQEKILNSIRGLDLIDISVLFLISEKKKLELEKVLGNLNRFIIDADWLVKPYSKNALLQSVTRLCS